MEELAGREKKRIAAANDYEKNYIFACQKNLHVGPRIVVARDSWKSITKGDWGYKKKPRVRVTCKLGAAEKIVFPLFPNGAAEKEAGKTKDICHNYTHAYSIYGGQHDVWVTCDIALQCAKQPNNQSEITFIYLMLLTVSHQWPEKQAASPIRNETRRNGTKLKPQPQPLPAREQKFFF